MTCNFSAKVALKYLKNIVDTFDGNSCMLYSKFGRDCDQCPFTKCDIEQHTYKTCGLRTIRSFLQDVVDKEVASPCCDDEPKGCQKDFNKSILKRVQMLEELQRADSSFIYQSDHQKIADLERGMKDLKEKLRKI